MLKVLNLESADSREANGGQEKVCELVLKVSQRYKQSHYVLINLVKV